MCFIETRALWGKTQSRCFRYLSWKVWDGLPKPRICCFYLSNTMSYCCSVAQSCPTLCSPIDWSMPGFPILHHLLELAQTHVHWVDDAIQPSQPLSPPSPPALSFPASGSFPMNWLFASGGQSIGDSASASVLSVNIQGWFPLGWTGLISLLSKGLSRVFSNTAVQRH